MRRFFSRLRKKHKLLFPLGVFLILFTVFHFLQKIETTSKVGVVIVENIIFSTHPYLEQINNFANDENIKAIILQINSPGGAVAPVQEIFNKLLKVREQKPIYTSVSTLAASGGYYLASASDKIFANKSSTLGSIGVIFQYVHYGDLLKKIGAEPIVIKSGKHKDIVSPFRKPSEKEIIIIQELVDESYEQFISDIALGRSINKEKILPVADGRVFSGVQAKRLNLIDELGGLEQLLEYIKQTNQLKKLELIYPEKQWTDYWQDLKLSLGFKALKNLQLTGVLAIYSF